MCSVDFFLIIADYVYGFESGAMQCEVQNLNRKLSNPSLLPGLFAVNSHALFFFHFILSNCVRGTFLFKKSIKQTIVPMQAMLILRLQLIADGFKA